MGGQRKNGRSVEYLALLPEPLSQPAQSASWGALYFVGFALLLLVWVWTSSPTFNTNSPPETNGQTIQPLGAAEAMQAANSFAYANGNGAFRFSQLQKTGDGWTAVYGTTQASHSNGSLCVEFARRGGDVRPHDSYACP